MKLIIVASILLLIGASHLCEAKNRKARPPVGGGIGNAGNWLPRGPIFGAGAPDDGTFPPWYGGVDFGDDDGVGFGDASTGDFFDGGAGRNPFRETGDGFGWHNNGWAPPNPHDSSFGCPNGDCVRHTWTGQCEYMCSCYGAYDPYETGVQEWDNKTGVHKIRGECVRYMDDPTGEESCRDPGGACTVEVQ